MAAVDLTVADQRTIEDAGYLVVPGLVAPERVRAALTAINASLGGQGLARDDLARMRAATFCRELAGDPVIVDLYRATPLSALGEAALGPGRVRAPREAQIALRFPDPREGRAEPRP